MLTFAAKVNFRKIMILKSINSAEFKESDALPIEVKELAKSSVCFFMVSHPQVIQCDQSNYEDYKNAWDKYEELKDEYPDEPFILMGTNPHTLISSYMPTYQFPPSPRPRTFAIEALNKLKVYDLIDSNTEEETWLYVFNYAATNTQKKIKWLGTNENLRDFLERWFEAELNHKRITFRKIKGLVPFCFVKKGKPMHLSNKKIETTSHRPQYIEEIFRPKEE